MDIKNTKEVIVLACVGFQGYVDAKADGKLDGADIGHLIPVFQAVGPAVEDVKLVIPELKNLSELELNEIVTTVQQKCPALKTKAEAILRIKAVLKLLLAGKDCYLAFAKPEVPAEIVAAGRVDKTESSAEAVKANLLAKEEAAKPAAPAQA